MPIRKDLKHILLPENSERADYTPVTGFVPGEDRPVLTARQQRFLHATKLQEDITAALESRTALIENIRIPDVDIIPGVCLDIEGADHQPLDIDALENRGAPTAPVELLNVRMVDGKIKATIFVPDRRIDYLKGKVQKYGDESYDANGTKGLTISVDTIEAIRLAGLDAFWMEDSPLPTDSTVTVTWEAWIRRGMLDLLRTNAARFGITVSAHSLRFHECDICLLTAPLNTLAVLQLAVAPLVGFRYREAAPGFFIDLPPYEQAEWVQEMARRLQSPDLNAPAVCLLDTGVRNSHQLLSASLADGDCDSYDPTWQTDDHHGHGTQMAGIALLGDLSPHLSSTAPVTLQHRLESVKILPPRGENPEELYGWITQESIARAQVNAPQRKRVFCLAVTNSGRNTNGKPTAWSAAVDKLSMGVDADLNIDDEKKQLFVVSVGNIRDTLVHGQYPNRNDVEAVENPSQSWNALSVGATTLKAFSEDKTLDGWELVAQVGDIAPTSRTSVDWTDKEWPIKPDIVLEGGNCVSDGSLVSIDPDLSLLTTGRDVPLQFSRDTSAATAEAARIAAILQAEYPDYWPETIRGLMVHSANWNEAMFRGVLPKRMRAGDKENLLRRFGYGIPSLELARFSASNRACIISQQYIQPFSREQGDAGAGYLELNYHKLPWPVDFLKEHGNTKIRLRVTLSYFIEPNPSDRLPTQKYSYASHRLKFALQRPLETEEKFRQRVNKNDRTPGESYEAVDSDNWLLGVNTRNKGSVVSDVWEGTAAALADQAAIAVMPEGGWWKYRKHLNRSNQKARYALLITLDCENAELDIYTQIKNQIGVAVENVVG